MTTQRNMFGENVKICDDGASGKIRKPIVCPNTGKRYINTQALIKAMQAENKRYVRQLSGQNLQRPQGATSERLDKFGQPIAVKSKLGSIDTRNTGKHKVFAQK